MDTLSHIRSMQATSLALEAEARASGQYSRDCARVNDALTRGAKSGVALLWDSAGRLEVVSLNNGADHVQVTDEGNKVQVSHSFPEHHNPGREEGKKRQTEEMVGEASEPPYRQMNGKHWENAKTNSHVRENETSGKFPPQVHEGARTLAKKQPAGDAARLAKENAEKERNYRADAIARNTLLAQRMKEASDKMWKKGA